MRYRLFLVLCVFPLWGDPLTILHSFNGSDGASARGSLTLSEEQLYGRTSAGGSENQGVIFRLDTSGNNFQVLYSFTPGKDNGTGNNPHHDAMALVGSTLYGTTVNGGEGDNGIVFSIQTDGSNYTPIRVFKGGATDGAQQHSCFLVIGDLLYGLTAEGGTSKKGTIYTLNPADKSFRLLRSLVKPTGDDAHGRLTLGQDGKTLFGMTRKGGKANLGVIFSLTESQSYKVLHTFRGGAKDGAVSDHGYLVLVGETLYGMTTNGGSANKGVLFKMDQTGKNFALLHTFGVSPNDGAEPYGSLAVSNNLLYGMTRIGGAHNFGTLFQIDPTGSGYQTLVSFDGATAGAYPIDNVVFSEDGKVLYGMTQIGGKNDPQLDKHYGTIFSYLIP